MLNERLLRGMNRHMLNRTALYSLGFDHAIVGLYLPTRECARNPKLLDDYDAGHAYAKEGMWAGSGCAKQA